MDDAIDKIEDIFGADKSQHVAGTTSTPVSTITSQGVSCVVFVYCVHTFR